MGGASLAGALVPHTNRSTINNKKEFALLYSMRTLFVSDLTTCREPS